MANLAMCLSECWVRPQEYVSSRCCSRRSLSPRERTGINWVATDGTDQRTPPCGRAAEILDCRIGPYLDQGVCAALRRDGAARATLWLEARSRGRAEFLTRAACLRRLIPASLVSGVGRNPSRALCVASRWPAATLN